MPRIPACNAPVCRVKYSGHLELKHSGHRFRFPTDPTRCKLWIDRAGLNDKYLDIEMYHRSYRLCGEHFERSQFTNELKMRLNKNAIPTIFGDKIYDLVDAEGNLMCDEKCLQKNSYFPETLGKSAAWRVPDTTVRAPDTARRFNPPSPQTDLRPKAYVGHKSLLAEASPKLAAMLNYPSSDAHDDEQGYAVLNLDLDEEVCCELLRFVYLGKLGYVKDKVKLLEVAKELEVSTLFDIMQKAIEVTSVNAVEMFVLADRLEAEELKVKAIEYINSHCSAVMQTSGWSSMVTTQPYLLATLYKAQMKS